MVAVRRLFLPGLVALLALAIPPVPARGQTVAPGAVEALVIEGRGWGHGVGMAQDGLYWMGKAGTTTPKILQAFYPGTTIGKRGGAVRVLVLASTKRETTLSFPNGGRVEADGGRGFPVTARAGEEIRVGHDGGRYWAQAVRSAPPPAKRDMDDGEDPDETTTTTTDPTADSTTTTIVPPDPTDPTTPTTALAAREPSTSGTTTTTTTAAPPADRASSEAPLRVRGDSGSSVALSERGRRYRGTLDVRLDAAGLLRVVNTVDVETYLKGMGEVRDSRWPAASLRGQAIAARTYALRAMAAGGEICDDQRCQVYLGSQAEYAAMNKAVADTASQVVLHAGKLASTVYSANAGGHSASREEGFGTAGDGYPYLRPAPYTTKDQMPWTVKVSLADVRARLGYPGRLSSVAITRTGPSGRAIEVTLDGDGGRVAISGRTFDARLGLKSTLFTLKVDRAVVAPLPPLPAGEVLQALPEEAVHLEPLPPRPPDPPLPAELLARAAPEERPVKLAARQIPAPYKSNSTNVPLALFLLATLGIITAAVAANRGSLSRMPAPPWSYLRR